MNITNNISNLFGRIVLKPIQRAFSLAQTALDKISCGRGLKIWAKPAIREIKSKENFHEFRLENGLKVLVKRAPGTQVKTELVINSGATKDPKGKEGLAHFLEHV